MRIGPHCPVSGGYAKTVEYLLYTGGNTLQIFSGNPRGWARKPINKKKAAEFTALREKHGIGPLFIHAPYLINIAGQGEIYDKSVIALKTEFQRADMLNADYLVLHPGSSINKKDGIKQIVSAFKTVTAERAPKTKLLIENTAGSGNQMGNSPEELLQLRDRLGLQAGFCIDTAHAFQAGFSMEDMEDLAPYTRLIHVNDSKTGFGSHSDMHAGIGEGSIGISRFASVINSPLWKEKAFIIETPGGKEADLKNINLLKSLRED